MFELRKDDPNRLVIVANSAHCTACGADIFSSHRHDMVWCRCGNIAVDGGQDYLRRAFSNRGSYIDTSISVKTGCLEACGESVQTYLDQELGAGIISLSVLSQMGKWSYVKYPSHSTRQFLESHLDALKAAAQWGIDSGRNNWGIVFAVIRAMRDEGILYQETE